MSDFPKPIDRPVICLCVDVIKGDDGNVVPHFFEWLERARPWFQFVIYSPYTPETTLGEFFQWLLERRAEWCAARGDETPPRPMSWGFSTHRPDAFLTIDSRAMQFRGDWDAWWIDPIRLTGFKSWREPGADMKCSWTRASSTSAPLATFQVETKDE